MDKKSIQKSIKNLMPPGIGFWKDFGGLWEGKWSQVGTKMGSKIDVNFERPILHNIYKTNRILMIFEVREVEKSIKNQ